MRPAATRPYGRRHRELAGATSSGYGGTAGSISRDRRSECLVPVEYAGYLQIKRRMLSESALGRHLPVAADPLFPSPTPYETNLADLNLKPGGAEMVKTEDEVGRNSRPPLSAVDDNEVRALLMRYQCPVPFHAVRTRFLGNIASPILSASPLDAVKALWGGELPEFNGLDALNELLRVLVMGLWNRLARHQERNTPFRLMRVDVPATREGLTEIALIRRDELDGFVEGAVWNGGKHRAAGASTSRHQCSF